jgi:hypothetical protein
MDSLGEKKVKAMTKRIAALGLILTGMTLSGQAWADASPTTGAVQVQTKVDSGPSAAVTATNARSAVKLAWDRVGAPIRPAGLGMA